jgi:hypothetical protein
LQISHFYFNCNFIYSQPTTIGLNCLIRKVLLKQSGGLHGQTCTLIIVY